MTFYITFQMIDHEYTMTYDHQNHHSNPSKWIKENIHRLEKVISVEAASLEGECKVDLIMEATQKTIAGIRLKMKTIAEKIAYRYNNDGMNWLDEEDIDLTDLCDQLSSYVDSDVPWKSDQDEGLFNRVYYFSDASFITMTENTWDIPNEWGQTHDNCIIK